MTGVFTSAELLVDRILSNPPSDNAVLLDWATDLERDAVTMEELLTTWRFQARRLRDYAAVRQAQMDVAPPENTIAPDAR
ncbi:MAG: hypothetical protein ABF665_09240 [Gluconacetobacter sp.]